MAGPLPDEAAITSQLRRLGPTTFTELVTALWVARGWEVEGVDTSLHVSRVTPVADERVYHLHHRGNNNWPSDTPEVDGVITNVQRSDLPTSLTDGDLHLIAVEDLTRLLRYGIDRDAAIELCRQYFTFPEAAFEPPPDRLAPDGSRLVRSGQPANRLRALSTAVIDRLGTKQVAVMLLVVGLLVVGVAGGTLSPLDSISLTHPAAPSNDQPIITGEAPDQSGPSGTAQVIATPTESPAARIAEDQYLALTPTCERPPELVVAIIVGALANNDPETNAGIRAAWAFSDRPSNAGATFYSFVRFLSQPEFGLLFTHQTVTTHRPIYLHEDIVTQDLTMANATHERTYRFVLSKQSTREQRGCWQLAGILQERNPLR